MIKNTISEPIWSDFLLLFKRIAQFRGISESLLLKKLPELKEAIETYASDFLTLNEEINLSAIRDWDGVIWKHFYDSFNVIPFLPHGKVLDWGTGGGFPGVPILLWLSLFEPNISEVIFLDNKQKKLKAIENLLVNKPLSTHSFSHAHGQEFITTGNIAAVVMRAVAPPERLIPWISPKVKNWFFFSSAEQINAWEGLKSSIFVKKRGILDIHTYSIPENRGNHAIISLKFT